MAYSVQADIEKLIPSVHLIELTDDTSTGSANTTAVFEAISTADGEIDSFLGVKFAVPLAGSVPEMINKLSVDIAIYNLYSRTQEEIPETRQVRYSNAIDRLKGIVKGTVSIGVDPEKAAKSETNIGTAGTTTSDFRVFTQGTLSNYFTDI